MGETVTFTATDGCGLTATTQATFTIEDPTDPVLIIPGNVTIDCSESTDPSNTGQATASDGCDPAPVVTYSDSSSGACPEVITRTWNGTDACGNTALQAQTITVQDNGAPAQSDSETFDIVVSNINAAPILNPIGDQVAKENRTHEIRLEATDTDGDSLAFSASVLPAFCNLTDNFDGTTSKSSDIEA